MAGWFTQVPLAPNAGKCCVLGTAAAPSNQEPMIHKHSIYEHEGTTIKLLKDQILVEVEPAQTKSDSGLIHYAEGSMEKVTTTGIIRAFGYERHVRSKCEWPIPDIGVGERCLFIRFLGDTHTNLLFQKKIGKDMILIKPKDIIAMLDDDEAAPGEAA